LSNNQACKNYLRQYIDVLWRSLEVKTSIGNLAIIIIIIYYANIVELLNKLLAFHSLDVDIFI